MSDNRFVMVREFVQRWAGAHGGPTPAPGSPEWCALPDDDPAKMLAVLVAGSRLVLEESLTALDDRRHALKSAAVEVSEAKQWAEVGRQIAQRDQFLRENPWAARKVEGYQ